MTPAAASVHVAPQRRCDHCGRVVHGTRHTRTDYAVDYYALHGGHGEVCELIGHPAQGATYVRLLDHIELVSCADCYRRADVQAERERQFRPERAAAEASEA